MWKVNKWSDKLHYASGIRIGTIGFSDGILMRASLLFFLLLLVLVLLSRLGHIFVASAIVYRQNGSNNNSIQRCSAVIVIIFRLFHSSLYAQNTKWLGLTFFFSHFQSNYIFFCTFAPFCAVALSCVRGVVVRG